MGLLSGGSTLYQLLRQDDRIRGKPAPNISSCFVASAEANNEDESKVIGFLLLLLLLHYSDKTTILIFQT